MSAPATRWEHVYATQTARITELERENAALREDKERLDWLDESGAEVQKYGNSKDGSVLFFVDLDWSTVFAADTLRAAIDAAKEAKP